MNKNDYINEVNNIKSSEKYKEKLLENYSRKKKSDKVSINKRKNINKMVYGICTVLLIFTILGIVTILKNGDINNKDESGDIIKDNTKESTTENSTDETVNIMDDIIESKDLPVKCSIDRSDNKCILNIIITNNSEKTASIFKDFTISKIVDGICLKQNTIYDKAEFEDEKQNDDNTFCIESGKEYHISVNLYDVCPEEHWYLNDYYGTYEISFGFIKAIYMSSIAYTNGEFNTNSKVNNSDMDGFSSILDNLESKVVKDEKGEYIFTGSYVNKQNTEVSTGNDYKLYYCFSSFEEAASFEMVEMKEGVGFNEIMCSINPGQEYNLNLKLSDVFDIESLDDGYYVIVKEFYNSDMGTKDMVVGKFSKGVEKDSI